MIRLFRGLSYSITLSLLSAWPIHQAHSGDKGAYENEHHVPGKENPSPDALAIKDGLDGITRTLKEEHQKPESDDEYRRAEQDLKAQKDSARWNMVTGLMAAISVFIGFIGLRFLWETVRYTKEAAISAGETVKEAEKATAVANNNVQETRRIGEAQVRCYPSILSTEMSFSRAIEPRAIQPLDEPDIADATDVLGPVVRFKIKNFGSSPALNLQYHFSIKYGVLSFKSGRPKLSERQSSRRFPFITTNENKWGDRLPAMEEVTYSTLCRFRLTEAESEAISLRQTQGQLHVTLVIALRFNDVFGNLITEDYCFVGMFSEESRDQYVKLIPMPVEIF